MIELLEQRALEVTLTLTGAGLLVLVLLWDRHRRRPPDAGR